MCTTGPGRKNGMFPFSFPKKSRALFLLPIFWALVSVELGFGAEHDEENPGEGQTVAPGFWLGTGLGIDRSNQIYPSFQLTAGLDAYPGGNGYFAMGVVFAKPFSAEVTQGAMGGKLNRFLFLGSATFQPWPRHLWIRALGGLNITLSNNADFSPKIAFTGGGSVGFAFWHSEHWQLGIDWSLTYTPESRFSFGAGGDAGRTAEGFESSMVSPARWATVVQFIVELRP